MNTFKVLLLLFISNSGWSEIKILSLGDFTKVPDMIRKQFKALGCKIPQSVMPQPNNLISGEFAKKGQGDWAALCTKAGVSSIFIIWGGTVKCDQKIASAKDAIYLQNLGNDKIEYSRGISAVNLDSKMSFQKYKNYGGDKPPSSFDHQAINDAFIEKVSTVYYCHAGKWLSLIGAD